MSAKKTKSAAVAVPEALRMFDSLPDCAFVRLKTVTLLFACSAPTVWRRCAKGGDLPAPIRLGKRMTVWQVGALRETLRAMATGGGSSTR